MTKDKAAKMKAQPKQRRLTRRQRQWLKVLEFVPADDRTVVELLDKLLPIMVHGSNLGCRVICVPSVFGVYLDGRHLGEHNAQARRKLIETALQEGIIVTITSSVS